MFLNFYKKKLIFWFIFLFLNVAQRTLSTLICVDCLVGKTFIVSNGDSSIVSIGTQSPNSKDIDSTLILSIPHLSNIISG